MEQDKRNLIFLTLLGAALFLFAFSRRGVTRGDGLFLLVMYIGYTAYLVASHT